MSFDQKRVVREALIMALSIARQTNNPFDDIIVSAAVAILNKVFDLGMEL